MHRHLACLEDRTACEPAAAAGTLAARETSTQAVSSLPIACSSARSKKRDRTSTGAALRPPVGARQQVPLRSERMRASPGIELENWRKQVPVHAST